MKFNPNLHHRHSIRLRGYDYSGPGTYFVTICALDRANLFGDMVGDRMFLNDTGRIAAEKWKWLAEQYEHVEIDEWVVMPNHLHGILVINGVICRGGSRTAPTNAHSGPKRKPLGRLIGAFKTVSTKQINKIRGKPGLQVWQRNYYEQIVRSNKSLNRIKRYIAGNPAKWANDKENPSFRSSGIMVS